MRLLRWMMGIKRTEKIRIEERTTRAGVANISEQIREMEMEREREGRGRGGGVGEREGERGRQRKM